MQVSNLRQITDDLVVPVTRSADYLDLPGLFDHCVSKASEVNAIDFFKFAVSFKSSTWVEAYSASLPWLSALSSQEIQ